MSGKLLAKQNCSMRLRYHWKYVHFGSLFDNYFDPPTILLFPVIILNNITNDIRQMGLRNPKTKSVKLFYSALQNYRPIGESSCFYYQPRLMHVTSIRISQIMSCGLRTYLIWRRLQTRESYSIRKETEYFAEK